jgi:hypothetical protein
VALTQTKKAKLQRAKSESRMAKLDATKIKFLTEARDTLQWRSTTLKKTRRHGGHRLGETLCWQYFEEKKEEAKVLDLYDQLYHMVLDAAGRFANKSMLRSGQRYYKYGPPDVPPPESNSESVL